MWKLRFVKKLFSFLQKKNLQIRIFGLFSSIVYIFVVFLWNLAVKKNSNCEDLSSYILGLAACFIVWWFFIVISIFSIIKIKNKQKKNEIVIEENKNTNKENQNNKEENQNNNEINRRKRKKKRKKRKRKKNKIKKKKSQTKAMSNFLEQEENELSEEKENETEDEKEEEKEEEKEKEKENENENEKENEKEKETEEENKNGFPKKKNDKRTKKRRRRKKKRTKRNRILEIGPLKSYSLDSSVEGKNETYLSKIQIKNDMAVKKENHQTINEQENEIINELTKLEQKINSLLTETRTNELRNGLEDEEDEGSRFNSQEKGTKINEIKLDNLKMISVNNFGSHGVGNQDLEMDQNTRDDQDFNNKNRAAIENIENLDDDIDGNNVENNNNHHLGNGMDFQYVNGELNTDCKVSFYFLVMLWFLSTIVLAGCIHKIRHLDNCHSGKVLLLVATSCVLVQNAISFITLTIYYSLNYDISTLV
ncbi:hypothetical protein M0812_10183 [Anaeramoeba flamelloides]|uniref:Uncharacterized protein n=1 Tax=Anaeramoeba flamelloides TaxID=1746091 RepID=A0AAV7ZV58_9EUKA|nr:hypothetical protein M0812_10183 [Anaeramoeba flamelloides]